MSVRQQIRDAIITALNAETPTGVPEATKRRFIPGMRLTEPILGVFFADEETQPIRAAHAPVVQREFLIAIQAVVVVEDVAEADDAAEVILEHVVATLGPAIHGAGDAAFLKPYATDCTEVGTTWAAATEASLVYLAALMRWRIQFKTNRSDITRTS